MIDDMAATSSFLTPGLAAQEGHLASLHLRRDASIPVVLASKPSTEQDAGYAEGMVTNTRFGSFPHSTIIGTPWGSQIRASKVDTGSRGRVTSKKRKASELRDEDAEEDETKEAESAESGFLHVLPPTPESWTYSLPHRTQVVYTPDYSYILHRIRARPGTRLIEAGSGSGSFTHAAARAVFNGYPSGNDQSAGVGRVYSYEFHKERHEKVAEEMKTHNLSSLVTCTHADAYKDGFLLPSGEGGARSQSPRASAIFLDLPAPWSALPHLTRTTTEAGPSALDPDSPVYICTFSPCIEQAQKTISYLRKYSWLDIQMVEVNHKRLNVLRSYISLAYSGMRGVNPYPEDVSAALDHLKAIDQRAKDFHAGSTSLPPSAKVKRIENSQTEAHSTMFKEGQVIHRSEPELKTHTSYLVFAVLPREWTEEDEQKEAMKWSGKVEISAEVPKSQRQMKKETKAKRKSREAQRQDHTNGAPADQVTMDDASNAMSID
jgi:tRNA (adenine57-N1/adenine58-N1)-methyltransferase catalytic subunit